MTADGATSRIHSGEVARGVWGPRRSAPQFE